ncbi:MAG: RagB/SusD family nutrient uptake outer membrane protein [Saprospiraceae bacterium]|nr:RagB/SusD family nutrient uptake outer membrane protein [Saprospiraceae bacterium]MDW8483759.1 RagB/SusD family nutrient uptake outer membrane protein [Saprospiraceae bacterium]
MKRYVLFLLLPVLLSVPACQKEFLNPNAADGSQVIKTADGLTALIVGIKRDFSVGATSALYNAISSNGLTTRELYVINTGNGELTALESGGGTVGGNNAFINNLWATCHRVKANAQLLIDNAANVRESGTTEMIRVYGHVFKALAIGTLANFWEQIPTEVVPVNEYLAGRRPRFKNRIDALREAIALLEAAQPIVESVTPSTFFNTKVGTDIDIKNLVYALQARYNLMVGDYAKALAAANKVDLSKRSVFRFDAVSQNPVFRISLVNNNTYNGVVNFGLTGVLTPEPGDGRIPFYLGNNMAPVRVQGFFKSDSDPIPLYLPGEITLIKAECHARLDQLPEAIAELNKVRTKTSDPFGVTAKLGPYAGNPNDKNAILLDIYQQRCIELYMSGLKLEDSRRFGRPGPGQPNAERNRNFYPYPTVERDNNPNTPPDPPV